MMVPDSDEAEKERLDKRLQHVVDKIEHLDELIERLEHRTDNIWGGGEAKRAADIRVTAPAVANPHADLAASNADGLSYADLSK